MPDLVIVESPAKAKTIQKYLGPGYEVIASMGHVRDLPKSKIAVDFENDFEPNYVEMKGKEDVIKDLKKHAQKCDKVYLATDPDREGKLYHGILHRYLISICRKITGSHLMKSQNSAFSRV